MLSRRALVIGTAATAAAGGAYLAGPAWRSLSATQLQPLRIPDLIDARKQDQSIALNANAGTTAFFPGRESRTLGYNGSYLGPTIRVYRGDDVEMAVTNALNQETTVHWHGLLVPAELDGGPHQVIRPGATWRPVLPIRQPAATLFYHSHMHGRTAEQVYAGLAGVLIVRDDDERALGLPSDYGVDDLPLVLQDRQFEDGRLVLPDGMMVAMQGRRGATILANGTPNALARVPSRLVRLRFVNASNARIFDLSFGDARAFHWIASDGGLLEKPVELRSLALAPGERAEILVDFSDGRPVALHTEPDLNAPMMMGVPRRLRSFAAGLLGNEQEHVLQFEPARRIGAGAIAGASVPERLTPRKGPDASRVVRRRRFVLNMGMGGMMGGGMGGMMGSATGSRAPMHAINGRGFDIDRIDETVRIGDVEIWEVSGEMMAHPFHIHGVQFEVLSRDGGKPELRDQGLRDTVPVKGPVELLVQFTQPAETTPFMYHCHILEHEDGGMMGQFTTR